MRRWKRRSCRRRCRKRMRRRSWAKPSLHRRLGADAKQQIQAATREAASQAVSAERRLSFEQWEQKFAAGRAEIANETAQAIEKFQHETDEHSRTAHAAAAEALRTELPRWLAPQLEQLTHELTTSRSREGAAQRN